MLAGLTQSGLGSGLAVCLLIGILSAANLQGAVAATVQQVWAQSQTGACDWPWQYYSDFQIQNWIGLASQENLAPPSADKSGAWFDWQAKGCSRSNVTYADLATLFSSQCLNTWVSGQTNQAQVPMLNLGNEVDAALWVVKLVMEHTCGNQAYDNRLEYDKAIAVSGWTSKSGLIPVACLAATTMFDLGESANLAFTVFDLTLLANAAGKVKDFAKPLRDSCTKVEENLQSFCQSFDRNGLRAMLYNLLYYRDKVKAYIGYLDKILVPATFFDCLAIQNQFAAAEAALRITRPTTKCQLAPGQTVVAGQTVVPDPAHCNSNLPVFSGRRRLQSMQQGWDDPTMSPPLRDYRDGRALLQTSGTPASDALTKLNSLTSKFSGIYALYQEYHAAITPLTDTLHTLFHDLSTVMDEVSDFLGPFTPFEGVLNSIDNVLQYIQCPDLGPLNFVCNLGNIIGDAISALMKSLNLPDLDAWVTQLLSALGLPNFAGLALNPLNDLLNTFPAASNLINTITSAYKNDMKAAFSISYWMGTYNAVKFDVGVTLNRAIGQDGSITYTCPSGQYPIVDSALHQQGGCTNEIGSLLRYPCKNSASCTRAYSSLDTVCNAYTAPPAKDSIALAILSDFGITSMPGYDLVISMFYCVDPKLSTFGPWPVIRSATAQYSPTYDAGWWGNDSIADPRVATYETANPQLVVDISGQVTSAPKIHAFSPQVQVPSMFDPTANAGVNAQLVCPGQRQLLLNSIQPQLPPKTVSNAPSGAWDPCFTSWLVDANDSTISSVPAGTPWSAQQLWTMLKSELCFFKWYSTFATTKPAPWVTNPTNFTTIYFDVFKNRARTTFVTLGKTNRQNICAPYYFPNDTSQGCASGFDSVPRYSLGTFSFIDAVYGPNDDGNYLCNGLSHGSLYYFTAACYTTSAAEFRYSNGNVLGMVSGKNTAVRDIVSSINNYTGKCSLFADGAALGTTGSYCCDYNTCTMGCRPYMIQNNKADWKAMCDGGYSYPNPYGDSMPPSNWNAGAPSFTPAQDKAFRTAHRAIRQAVLDSYNGAINSTAAANACVAALNAKCNQSNNCTIQSTNCFPANLQAACVEPSYFKQAFPTYTVYLWGDAVGGSGTTAYVTCPGSAQGMVAVLVSAAIGSVNAFDAVDVAIKYTSACTGNACALDINYAAKALASLPSASGKFMKTIVKCVCGPGWESISPPANSTNSTTERTASGSSSANCSPCGSGSYRNGTMSSCNACPLGYYQPLTGQSSCVPCPAGQYSNKTASTQCFFCPAGTSSVAVAATSPSTCLACPVNSISTTNGSTACTPCLDGWYTVSTGQARNCTQCAPGSYRRGSMVSCSTCLAGTYSSRGNSTCTAAPAGTCATSSNQSYAEQCGWGSYSSTAGAMECAMCNSTAPTTAVQGAVSARSCVAAVNSSVSAVNWTTTALQMYGDKAKTYDQALCSRFCSMYGGNITNVGNGFCNQGPYNVALCNWDGGDCCADTCIPKTYTNSNNQTITFAMSCSPTTFVCHKNVAALNSGGSSGRRLAAFSELQQAQPAASRCLFNTQSRTPGGRCGTSNPKDKRLGNGVCDADLNTGAGVCQYDKGDCCVGSCKRNPGIRRSCATNTFNCRDPTFANTAKDTAPPTLPTKLGSIVFTASGGIPSIGDKVPVAATDNDPCFSGIAYALVTGKHDMDRRGLCDTFTREWMMTLDLVATDRAGNTARQRNVLAFVVDDEPPKLLNLPFVYNNQTGKGSLRPPSVVKLVGMVGPVPRLVRDVAPRTPRVETAVITTKQLAKLNGSQATSSDDHACHDDTVLYKELTAPTLPAVKAALRNAGATSSVTARVQAFYKANAGRKLVLRTWKIADPGGNSDNAVQLLAVR